MLNNGINNSFEGSRLIKTKVILNKVDRIIYRNIVCPLRVSTIEVLELLGRIIPDSTVIPLSEESALSIIYDTRQESTISDNIIDKYWLDGIVYAVEYEKRFNEYKTLLIICSHDFNVVEIFNLVKSTFSTSSRVIIDELSDCWVLRKNITM